MKNLYFTLLGTGGTSDVPGFYLPGDTLGGRIHLATSSRVKYTCLLIQFVGTVKTKVAKAEEQIYVLNLQSVLLGNPDNTDEQVIGEGKHSWPFQFTIPQHHIPSSGKYRHSTVKYSISASFVSKGFLGKIRSLKASQTITIKDLINVKVEPYSLPVLARGKSNLQPDTNDPRNFATASVKLPRSAFLKGQKVQIEIDLYHPSKIQRNSGCIIELIKKESYYAGDCAKEYTNTIANCSAPLIVNSPVNSGKIMSEVIIPDSALPTMAATKAILVEYHLNILLDMRPKTGLLDLRNKTIKGKDRTQFLTIPGCFEVQIPITIGTTSDSLYTPRLGPFAQSPTLHHSMTPVHPASSGSGSPTLSGSPSGSQSSSPTPSPYLQTFQEPPEYTFNGTEDSPLGSNTPPLPSGRRQSDLVPVSTAPTFMEPHSAARNRSHTTPTAPCSNSLTTQFTALALQESLDNKPLPGVPRPSAQYQTIGAIHQYSDPRVAPAPCLPPRHASSMSIGSAYAPMGPNGYPLEKNMPMQFNDLPLPITLRIEQPTAPQAVDLGFEPVSPLVEHPRALHHERPLSTQAMVISGAPSPPLGGSMGLVMMPPIGSTISGHSARDSSTYEYYKRQ